MRMVAEAWLDLDRDVTKSRNAGEPCFIKRRRMRRIRHQSNDARQMSRPDLPQVQVNHAVAIPFKAVAHCRLNPSRLGSSIDQHSPSGAQQTPRPAPNDSSAGEANERIDEAPAECPGKRQAGNRQKRSCRIRQNVDVGRAEIQIMPVVAVVVMIVLVLAAQQPSTGHVDRKTQRGDCNGLAIGDSNWMQ